MYNKECGILYDSRTKKELRADLQLLEMQKLEIEHHINYIKDMLNKFRCAEFQKCSEIMGGESKQTDEKGQLLTFWGGNNLSMDKSQKKTKEKVKKYKCFNITKEELDSILAGEEQIRSCSESSDEDYAEWANIQIKNIRSFYSKVKTQ